MKASQIPRGGLASFNGVWAERVTPRYYRRCWHKLLPEGFVAFCAPAPEDKLDWWLVPGDEECEIVKMTTQELVGRN